MRKLFIAVVLLVAVPVTVFAVSNMAFVVQGNMGPTVKATLTDTARTMDNVLNGNSVLRGNYPQAVTISVETYDARFASGGTAPTVDNVGHVLAAGSSMRVSGTSAVLSMKLVNASAGDNSVIQVTPEY